MHIMDIEHEGGETERDVVTQSKLVYDWQSQDTCLPGCFYLEFKLLKMVSSGGSSVSWPSHTWGDHWKEDWENKPPYPTQWPPESDTSVYVPHGPYSMFDWAGLSAVSILSGITPSFTSSNLSTLDCVAIPNVEWVRRFPSDKEGYLIEIVNTQTSEVLV